MTRPYGYMDTELARRIISELGANNICERVTFHVMGEPTLHKDFFSILRHAEKEGVKVGLTTNGARLGAEIGKGLLEHNLYQVDISLQTPDTNSFTLRKSGTLTFDRYIEGILSFFSTYHDKYKETIFTFRFLNTRFHQMGMEKNRGQVRVISSTKELRDTFKYWAGRIYDIVGVERQKRDSAIKGIDTLVSYKWNVVEIYKNIFFETYLLYEWGNAFEDEDIRNAWGGYCFGMRDHFAVLHNGDVVLCCLDFDGNTKVGNLRNSSLKEVLSSDELGKIMDGFKRFQLVHPYCRHCLGSKSLVSWFVKPAALVVGLKILEPFFHRQTKVYQ
jgi:MoaA/NifB/PqqE/SkfB family radical SAM enzyme